MFANHLGCLLLTPTSTNLRENIFSSLCLQDYKWFEIFSSQLIFVFLLRVSNLANLSFLRTFQSLGVHMLSSCPTRKTTLFLLSISLNFKASSSVLPTLLLVSVLPITYIRSRDDNIPQGEVYCTQDTLSMHHQSRTSSSTPSFGTPPRGVSSNVQSRYPPKSDKTPPSEVPKYTHPSWWW